MEDTLWKAALPKMLLTLLSFLPSEGQEAFITALKDVRATGILR